jgi:hypothetical protein
MRFCIAGYGKFGRRALAMLHVSFPNELITVVELRLGDSDNEVKAGVTFVREDAVSFLSGSSDIGPTDWIIPTVPFHLAASLVLAGLPGARAAHIPERTLSIAPNPYPVNHSSICYSVADFICPDACPEGDLCSVTGEYREPLCLRLKQTEIPGFKLSVLRSRQILPGIGGYQVADLHTLTRQVGPGNNLIATACKCHAILTGIKRENRSEKPDPT